MEGNNPDNSMLLITRQHLLLTRTWLCEMKRLYHFYLGDVNRLTSTIRMKKDPYKPSSRAKIR